MSSLSRTLIYPAPRTPFNRKGYQPAYALQEVHTGHCETVSGGLEPSSEEPHTASRLLDPKELWNHRLEHQKAIAVTQVSCCFTANRER
jgi:hypothetical protein